MNRNEIAKQYRLLRKARTILRFLEYCLWMVLPAALGLQFVEIPSKFFDGSVIWFAIDGGKNVKTDWIIWTISFLWLFTFMALGILSLMYVELGNLRRWILSKLFFTNYIVGRYEKKWGMSYDQIESYVSHREKLGGDDSILYLFPFVNQLCQLNKGAREEQETFLSSLLSEDEIRDVFEKEYSDSQMEEAIRFWNWHNFDNCVKISYGEWKALMELLFQLAIVYDGIHKDEWEMLMRKMKQLEYGVEYIRYFKKRYSPLRAEFDDYERKSTSPLNDYSAASLKPYYAVLGLEEGASFEEIRQAYHNLAMQHHPDLPKNAGRIAECEEMMMKINNAYERLRR